MERLTCWGIWSIKSYTISVAKMTGVGFSDCWEQHNKEQHTLCVIFTWQIHQVINIIFWCESILIHHSSGICRREVSCMKLDGHGSTIHQLVSLDKYSIRTKISHQRQTSDIVSPVSWINTLELWWNLILVETHEQFQHLSFHDGWYKNMTTERTRLWFTLFSRIYHSIDSWWKTCSEKSRAGKSAIQDLGSMSTSGYLGV